MKTTIFFLFITFSAFAQRPIKPIDVKISEICSELVTPYNTIVIKAHEALADLPPLGFDINDIDSKRRQDTDKIQKIVSRNLLMELAYSASEARGQIELICDLLVDDYARPSRKPFYASPITVYDVIEKRGRSVVESNLSPIGLDSEKIFSKRTLLLNNLRQLIMNN